MITLSSATPTLLTGARLASDVSVAQSIYWEAVDRLWYVGQPDGDTSDPDRITVTRLTADGVLVDKMYIGHSGHGTGVSVERAADGALYLWVGSMPNGGWATALARIPYVPNGAADAALASVRRTPRSGVYRVSSTIDPTLRRLVFRWQSDASATSGVATGGYDLYDLDAAAAGTFTPLKSMAFGATGKTLQGFAGLGDHLYYLYGDKNTDNVEVVCTDWATGAVLQTQHISAFPAATGEKNREPEGLCVYQAVAGELRSTTVAFGIAKRINAADPDPDTPFLNIGRFPYFGTNPWVEIPYDPEAYAPNSAAYVPQYRIDGDQVHLHFSLSKKPPTGSTVVPPWAQGETLFTLPPQARPNRTQRLVGVVSGAAVAGDTMAVRFEVETGGAVRIWDERSLVGWVGADVGFWLC